MNTDRKLEKAIKSVAIRMDEPLELALSRLAAKEDRTFSDYVRRVLRIHVWGHAPSLDADSTFDHQSRD